ncbi:HAMP domain-containing sensor histidine kinase [Rhizobium rhizogenes]|uniref:sensor histidine kinase n=1 Tax=Rhizobium rhizogenes TaxID=359 RepID=UPI0022CC2201|nr:HAMP domain-containing sensor histidine kinase [Rhizobium rhizogenes]MCZ7464647.1 HAMP domain-containing sensor histidine kinase [Rhizobium rhizogenes]
MKAPGKSNPSLWWQLSWQLSIVVSAMIAVVIVGLCVYGVMMVSPNIGIWNDLSSTIDESLSLDPQKGLVITEGPALRSLKAKNEELWFVASTLDGQSAAYGTVPAAYAELSRYVHLMVDADIRGGAGVNDVALSQSVETSLGTVRVMFGGTSHVRAMFLTLLLGTYPIYVPLLVVILPAVFFSVPRIVHQALAGLSSVVRKAPEIDPRRAGSKLPVEDVPREVVPLIVSFNSILERLEQQFRARQRFLIDAAHELRTPIAIMQTRIEGLPEGPERRRLMEDVARLGETAEQLLAVERNDQVHDRWETVDLVEIARTVVADLAPLALSAGYDISFDTQIARYEMQGNPFALPRAVNNIVRNAIDHGGNRGMIQVSVLANGEIAISDEGQGIAEDQQERIFEPFYRVTPRSTGAGLGLSLVKQIVADHNGRVRLESSAFGSTFRLCF